LNPSIEELRTAIVEAERFLRHYGDIHLVQRLRDLDLRLAAGDLRAVQGALSESTGSMGSLNDRILTPANGDPIEESDVPALNARLRILIAAVAQRAKAARASMPPTPNSMVKLVAPAREYLAAYVAALESGWSPDNLRPAEVAHEQLAAIARDARAFLAGLEDREAKGGPITLPDGSQIQRLPGFTRWLWDGAFCGSIGLRWQPGTSELPPHVPGHIGFGVVHWERGKGHATRALGLMLDEARAVGLTSVELTTDPKNLASQSAIGANAGILVEWFSKPAAYGGGEALRFRIRL
jgi:predicted acetyltransferase